MATAEKIDVRFPPGFEYLFRPKRYKVAVGGRGSAKSWSYARALLLAAAAGPERVLCARELQNSISESVHRLLSDQIAELGLSYCFEVNNQSIRRLPYGPADPGSEFFFYGIKTNPNKVKSAEGITKCWVEEADKVSENSWEILIPTIRAPGSEIWITFNPDEESDPSYQRFVANRPPDDVCVTRTFNWHDNPWFPEVLRAEKDYLYRVDPEAAAHVWGGECRRNASSQIFRGKYAVEGFEVPAERFDRRAQGWDGPYFGVDWGFSGDPAVMTKLWVRDYAPGKTKGTLFVEYSVGGRYIEQDDLGPLFLSVPEAADRVIYADCARPETISHVRNKTGLRIEPCEKWDGCVEDGIDFLRSFERIVIHPRCKDPGPGERVVDHEMEARLYSYKVDRLTGDVTRDIVDKHNHCWDADRYALQPLIMQSTSSGVWARL